MKHKIIFLLLSILIVSSCNGNNDKLVNHKYFKQYLENDKFITSIKAYHDKILGNKECVISIDYIENTDTAFFFISYEKNMAAIMMESPVYYFTHDNLFVIINSKSEKLEKISEGQLVFILKNYFSEDYDSYLETLQVPLIITYECEIWKLVFVNGELISKSIYPYPETEINRVTHEYYVPASADL